MLDYNLANAGGAVIGFEARGPILGFNIPEAVLLANTGRSLYHSLQINFLRRMSDGLQFNVSYTYSRSKDTSSADPGSTSGGGKPDVPNVGFAVQGNQRNLDANYALSDFDRPHRFSTSFIYELPAASARGFRFSGFVQVQSGLPYSILRGRAGNQTAAQYTNLWCAVPAGCIAPRSAGPACVARWMNSDRPGRTIRPRPRSTPRCCARPAASPVAIRTTAASATSDATRCAGSGSVASTSAWRAHSSSAAASDVELRWDVFNVFNTVNFALPENVHRRPDDFGKITDTIGGPRVMQFGARFRF